MIQRLEPLPEEGKIPRPFPSSISFFCLRSVEEVIAYLVWTFIVYWV